MKEIRNSYKEIEIKDKVRKTLKNKTNRNTIPTKVRGTPKHTKIVNKNTTNAEGNEIKD